MIYESVYDLIMGIVLLSVIVGMFVLYLVLGIMQIKRQNTYKKTLNEHDRSVIADYESYTKII